MADFDQLWDYDQPEATERRFRDLLPAAEASADRAYHAELLTQIARTLGLQGRFDEAHAVLDEAAALLSDQMATARVRYLLERGRALRSSGRREEARPLFLQAWELGLANGEDSYATDAAHMVALVEPDSAQQLAWNLKALDLAERSPKARRWLGSLYNNIGWTYADAGRYDEALAIFERAVSFRMEQGAPDPIRIARWCVAKMLRLLGRVEEALALQQELRQQVDPSAGEGGFIFEELGECLLQLNRAAEARPYFAEAYRLLSADRWLANDEPDRLRRLLALSEGTEGDG